MPRYFFDTSAFTKLYHPEVGSDRIRFIFSEQESVFQISDLTILETQSAFAMKVRTGLSPAKADLAMDKVFKDVSSGFVATVELNPVHVEAAKLPVRKYGYVRRMRTLDALQLAIAVDLRQSGELDTFVVAGKLLAEIAVL